MRGQPGKQRRHAASPPLPSTTTRSTGYVRSTAACMMRCGPGMRFRASLRRPGPARLRRCPRQSSRPAVPLPRATPVGPSPAPTATPAPGSVLPSLAPAFTPIMPTAALLRSERIGRVIGAFLFFGLLCSLLALFAFITWRLRARAQAAFAERMTDTELAPVPAGPGVRPMQYRGAPDEVAMASQAKLPDRPLQPARAAAAPGALADYKSRCVSMLRLAGWDARTRPPGGNREPDVIARRGARLLALQCHVSSEPVDVQAVEDACLAREKQRSDLAAIVSRSRYTEACASACGSYWRRFFCRTTNWRRSAPEAASPAPPFMAAVFAALPKIVGGTANLDIRQAGMAALRRSRPDRRRAVAARTSRRRQLSSLLASTDVLDRSAEISCSSCGFKQ